MYNERGITIALDVVMGSMISRAFGGSNQKGTSISRQTIHQSKLEPEDGKLIITPCDMNMAKPKNIQLLK